MKRHLSATGFTICHFVLFACTCRCCGQESNRQLVATGRIELIKLAVVALREGGVVRNVPVTAGQRVEQGDLLLQLDEQIHLADLEVAIRQQRIAELESENEVDLKFAVKSRELSQKILERSENANETFARSITQTEIDTLRLELEKSVLSAEQAELTRQIRSETLALRTAELAVARQRLDERQLKSPIAGIVVQRLVQNGEYLQPGQPAMRIVNLDRLRVSFRLPDTQAGRIRNGVSVLIVLERGGEPLKFEGQVSFISPEIDTVQQDFLVWAEFDNTHFLVRPGEPCQVTLRIEEEPD